MITSLNKNNPFDFNRFGFAWEHIPAGGRHLDFGCGRGAFLGRLVGKTLARAVGVDVCREAIEAARKEYPHIEFIHQTDTPRLPLADGTFDSATALEVLEHLAQPEDTLREIHRLLRPGGILVVSVPRRHVFSFLDYGNYKFLFPRLHRWLFRLRYSRQEYDYRYVHNPDGLVGDVSAQKRWHEHFTEKQLKDMLDREGFEVLAIDGSGLCTRMIYPVHRLVAWLPPLRRAVRAWERWDNRHFESVNLFCLARKKH
jgi:SAM-dependent methyltransferase